MCLMVRGGSQLIVRFVGQRLRSQLLKIEQKLDTFFVFARYLKNEMSDLNESWYTHARWWEEETFWYWGCGSKVKVTLSIHKFATQLLHIWCVTDFSKSYFNLFFNNWSDHCDFYEELQIQDKIKKSTITIDTYFKRNCKFPH